VAWFGAILSSANDGFTTLPTRSNFGCHGSAPTER
jgi:hypothetical protein